MHCYFLWPVSSQCEITKSNLIFLITSLSPLCFVLSVLFCLSVLSALCFFDFSLNRLPVGGCGAQDPSHGRCLQVQVTGQAQPHGLQLRLHLLDQRWLKFIIHIRIHSFIHSFIPTNHQSVGSFVRWFVRWFVR